MVHIRLDDKRQLRFSDNRKADRTVLELALSTAASPVDWECPTIGGNRAVVSTEAPMLATLEVVTKRASEKPVNRVRASLARIGHEDHTEVVAADDSYSGSRARIHRRESDWFVADMDSTNGTYVAGGRGPGDRALNSDTAVRFRDAKVIFRSEPDIVDADSATDLLVIQDCE